MYDVFRHTEYLGQYRAKDETEAKVKAAKDFGFDPETLTAYRDNI